MGLFVTLKVKPIGGIMSLGTILFLLTVLYVAIIATVAFVFYTIGLSVSKSILLALLFVHLGIWNPIGWILFAVFGAAQYYENKQALIAKQAVHPRVAQIPTLEH